MGQLDNNNGSMCARHDELQVNWVTEYMNAVLSQSRWLVSNAIVSLRLVSFTKHSIIIMKSCMLTNSQGIAARGWLMGS